MDNHTPSTPTKPHESSVVNPEQEANEARAIVLEQFAQNLAQRERILDERDQYNTAEAARLEKRAAQLTEQIRTEHQALESKKSELTQREHSILTAEQVRDAGFANERAAFNTALHRQRTQLEAELADSREQQRTALASEMAALKSKRIVEIAQIEQAEQQRIRADIAQERAQLTAERTELEKKKGALSALQSENEGRKVELESNERMLERKEQRSDNLWNKRQEELDEDFNIRLEEERQSLASQQQSFAAENDRLRNSLKVQTDLLGVFDQLKQQLGGNDPADILRSLNSQTDELKRLREELATRPTDEMRTRYQILETEAKNAQARAESLEQQLAASKEQRAQTADLHRKNAELLADNASKTQLAKMYESSAMQAQAELDRIRSAFERKAEKDARYSEIEIPHFAADRIKPPVKAEIDEMTWLKGIGNACDTYGLHFNPRILKAFHTALKTAEWSPLTVLAGVSGTGKSELPRLYSHFGGIFFEPLSVQPNWDSQESMLGFFNSIDNKFDAQPLLRFLAQSQKPWSEAYPGLSDAVCLVLLDEMNLAHPELYFAEFLSKLELRRGRQASDVPFLPVKIGAGMEPYKLQLGRNVLWAGTMNQDETTKSLSDKVIDRSIIINFPRPTELKRRLQMKPLSDKNRSPALHKAAWQSWLARDVKFTEEEVQPFKQFIEQMNTSLEVAGRAIGHRVWQSVEYYMANYPDVRAAQTSGDTAELAKAMHLAFEDQIVQKVMPKLRGIDTRGKSRTDCLDKIRGQIMKGVQGKPFNLSEDFDTACELGYGQFIWQSAHYLKEEPTHEKS